MENGFIKLYRQIQNWEWYTDSATVHFFIHCILSANWKDKRWQGKEVKRGQFITSYAHLSMQTGLSVKQIRIRIDRLVDSGEIEYKGASNHSLITVCNYNTYQPKHVEEGKQKANKRHSKGTQRATTKEGKEYKEGKNNYSQRIVDTVPDIESIEDKNVILACHLWHDVNSLQPNNKTTQRAKVKTWSEPIRLMVEQDDRTYEEIWDLWKRVQKDEFWRTNILSPAKLRDKFDQLSIKLKPQKPQIDEQFIDSLF